MNFFFRVFAYIFSILFISSCTKGIIKSKTDPEIVQNIDFIHPFSDTYIIEDQNKLVYNDKLSEMSDSLILITLEKNKELFRLADYYEIQQLGIRKRLKVEMKEIVEYVQRYNHVQFLDYPKTLDSLFSRRGNRFCMVSFSISYIRTTKNLVNKRIEDIVIAIAFGHFYKFSLKYKTKLFVLIFDTVNKEITFCGSSLELTSPLDRNSYKNNFKKILTGYILPRKQI